MNKVGIIKFGLILLFISLNILIYWMYFADSAPTVLAERSNKEAVDEAYKLYSDTRIRSEQAFSLFHRKIDQIVNNKIDIMIKEYKQASKDAKNRCTDDPSKATPSDTVTNCDLESKNFSTACVANLLSMEFQGLKKAMNERKKGIQETDQCFRNLDPNELPNHLLNVPFYYKLLYLPFDAVDEGLKKGGYVGNMRFNRASSVAETILQEKQKFIDFEIEKITKALDLTVKAYDEMYWSYPLHIQYQETIKLLKEWNEELIRVRQKVEDYKPKFDNAATAGCT